MTLTEKVRAVEAVFHELDSDIAGFQNWSGLSCKFGCGKCCFKPDIEATALEFLPFAKHLHDLGLADAWLARLEDASEVCLILNPTQISQGLCTEYKHRGLICRLFGYSARTNKYSEKELVTCSIIKSEQSEAYASASEKVAAGESVPVMNQYYMRLHSIDYQLAQEFFPINQAIRKAIETVMQYYAYREASEA